MLTKNKYCKIKTLRNESDVEQFFIIRLLADFGYNDELIETKTTIEEKSIGKGNKRRNYKPDYIVYSDEERKKPVLIIDAKSPKENAEEGISDSQLYSSVLRRSLQSPKPDQYCIGTNGTHFIVKHFDSDDVMHELNFEDFQDGNEKFDNLKLDLSFDKLKSEYEKQLPKIEVWTPKKPTVNEIKSTFQKCHKRIWKRESLLPTSAFYEFTKLIFLKLREDERLRELRLKKEITKKDLHFHTEWIDSNSEVSPNPINSILFKRLTDGLEEQVKKQKKKPIFFPWEEITLKPSTIRSVVELLQDYDLSGIDEDLNGRMFEVFLSAAVRGKNLGAFFTPRNIVELMISIASPAVTIKNNKVEFDTILDGCCGSGGFLVDAMASMLAQIRENPSLSIKSKDNIEELLAQHLYGMESNPDIARIARINMFLHGDGGSRIYRVDTLDKDFLVEEGQQPLIKDEINELRSLIVDEGKKFDIILTNPPFASSYSSNDEHEKRILSQYLEMLTGENTRKMDKSAKSNILFLNRYHDLLKSGGRIAIVFDNSLLNSYSFSEHREWIRNNFIIRAIISLPKYSFIQAGAGGVTSILYLEKRKNKGQQQPPIFARTVKYTGISKSGKEIGENDLPDVLKEWKKFETTGKLFFKGTDRIGEKERDELFLIYADEITDRIDVSYHSPSFKRLIEHITTMEKNKTHEIKKISGFDLADKIDKSEVDDEIFKYIDIGAIDLERGQILPSELLEGTIDDLAERARLVVRENDVIFPLSYDSFGKVAIVPKELEDQLASTGFVVIHNNNYDDAILLWAIIRSNLMQKQFHHIASGYTQRGISKEHLNEIKFPIPIKGRKEIIESIKKYFDSANVARKKELEAFNNINSLMNN